MDPDTLDRDLAVGVGRDLAVDGVVAGERRERRCGQASGRHV
jgi:hypothetical protein